jgi:hypothetical protein
MNFAFYYCDKNKYMQQYKIPRLKVQIPSDSLVQSTWTEAWQGQILTQVCDM